MSSIDLSKFNLRTDLIVEKELLKHEENDIDGITITKTRDNGNYITISFTDITDNDNREIVLKHFMFSLKEILKENKIKESDSCLIIGLGNSMSTPDSLGPKTIKDITVTSHLKTLGMLSKGMREVSVFTPGVMANTGIESSLIIKSLIKEVKPDFIVAIDALAAKKVERLNKTIQITDTGIHPGSGIGNNRQEISKNTIGIPVIAIGIPTVTTSQTIVFDTISYLYKHISYIKQYENINKLSFIKRNYKDKLDKFDLTKDEKKDLFGLFGELSNSEQLLLIEEVLTNIELNLIVTPTEIDFLINKLSNLLSHGINSTLHRQINHL